MRNGYIDKLFSLDGKVAAVIGGTGELCGAMAAGLASAGAEVALIGRSEEKAKARLEAIESAGGKGSFIRSDVTTRENIEELADVLFERYGTVDVLINGAGVNGSTPFLDISDEEYERIFEVNLRSVFLACQIFGRRLIEGGKPASIINIGSMAAVLPLSRVFTYSMTKAAVHNLSKNLARDWAPMGIRVNTLVPGFFPAEQNKKLLTEDRVASIMGHTPMKRFGQSDELIAATLLLASERAGSFITGAEIIVDGGFSSMAI